MDRVLLTLSATSIDHYCTELARYQRRAERRIAALDALRTFIATMATPGEKAKAEFELISGILSAHFEQARSDLMTEQCALLAEALRERSLTRVVSLFNALSRDAFWQLLEQSVATLESPTALRAAEWCDEWLRLVKERSAAASPYPDTIDFKAAGVEVAEYAAMHDIHHFFTAGQGLFAQK